MQTSSSISQLRRKVLNSLKTLASLVYLADNSSLLDTALNEIENVADNMRKFLPTDGGILLRPVSLCERAGKIKQKYYRQSQRAHSLHSLKALHRPGRKRQDSRFRGRVGRKAFRLREVKHFAPIAVGFIGKETSSHAESPLFFAPPPLKNLHDCARKYLDT